MALLSWELGTVLGINQQGYWAGFRFAKCHGADTLATPRSTITQSGIAKGHFWTKAALGVRCMWTAGTRVLSCDQVHECTCSNSMVSRYQPNRLVVRRISGPLLDRADL